MVKKDLERIGTPDETHEGIADFHAAGRRSHIAGLLRNGATLVEARQLARHADVRQTMKYTHIGLEDQAQALAGPPAPFALAAPDGLRIGCAPGGALGHGMSPDVSGGILNDRSLNEQTPARPGFVSSFVASCHQMATYIEVEAAGIAPASRDPSVPASTCVAVRLIVGLEAPIDRIFFGLSHHEFNPNLNRRFGTGDPALASTGGASGRRPTTRPLGSAVRQPYGERVSSRHLSFGRLLTWPADQPRHATRHISNPVDPSSPPIGKDDPGLRPQSLPKALFHLRLRGQASSLAPLGF